MKTKFKIVLIVNIFILSVLSIAVILFFSNKYVPPVLMYHSIDYNYMDSKLSVSPQDFRRQIEFVSKNYHPLRLVHISKKIKEGEKIKRGDIAITFDDGYDNNYTSAFPILKEFKVPATIFLIFDKIGKKGYLKKEQIIEMKESGLIDFGSHTLSHKFLTDHDLDVARKEIFDSKKNLESMFNWKFEIFAYPGGRFNAEIRALAKEAGYYAAYATSPGENFDNDDIYALKRVRISRTSNNPLVFWLYSCGDYTWIKEWRDED